MGAEIRDTKLYGISKLLIELSALIVLCFGSWHAWHNLQVLETQLQDTRAVHPRTVGSA